jgi:guanylate kinase
VLEKRDSGIDIILDIDVQGGMTVKEKLPESILIFITPPSLDDLKKRLTGRATDSAEVIELRLKNAVKEMEYKDRYKHIIINDTVDKAAEKLKNLILSYRNN